MLSAHDESLFHQAALPIARASSSDHRFYDRCFLTVAAPDGSAMLVFSMGVYKNMNVIDGFAALAMGARQINVRVSRPLRPDLQTAVGGLQLEVSEPLHELRLTLDAARHPIGFDLRWRAQTPLMQEAQWWGTHHTIHERVAIDVQRYEQLGQVNGWISTRGQRISVQDWWGGRDHSWGVRGGVGGFEPYNGGQRFDGEGMLLNWFLFRTEQYCGYIARTEDEHGRQRGLDGALQPLGSATAPVRRITHATFNPRFPAGSRYYDYAMLDFVTEDDARWQLEATPLPSSVICRGGGYDGGWNDGRGLGVYRDSCVEHDSYEPTANADKARVMPAGTELGHNQRESMARIRLNGSAGYGDCTVIASGKLPRFGIGT